MVTGKQQENSQLPSGNIFLFLFYPFFTFLEHYFLQKKTVLDALGSSVCYRSNISGVEIVFFPTTVHQSENFHGFLYIWSLEPDLETLFPFAPYPDSKNTGNLNGQGRAGIIEGNELYWNYKKPKLSQNTRQTNRVKRVKNVKKEGGTQVAKENCDMHYYSYKPYKIQEPYTLHNALPCHSCYGKFWCKK